MKLRVASLPTSKILAVVIGILRSAAAEPPFSVSVTICSDLQRIQSIQDGGPQFFGRLKAMAQSCARAMLHSMSCVTVASSSGIFSFVLVAHLLLSQRYMPSTGLG